MTIKLYKSVLCPRCAYASKIIKDLQKEYQDIELITYDIVSNISAFKEAGISMIPCVQIDNHKKSWVLPKKQELRDFILKHK